MQTNRGFRKKFRRNWVMTESDLQISIIKWANLQSFNGKKLSSYLFHVPMGGFRKKREAAKLKKMGAKAGVSDLFLALPSGAHSGLWVELKINNNGLTLLQEDWLNLMRETGYYCAVCHSLEEFIMTVKKYLKKN